MQAHKLMITNTSLQRFFSTTCWKSRRIGWTVDEILKWKGPRCLKPHRVMGKFLEKTKKLVLSYHCFFALLSMIS